VVAPTTKFGPERQYAAAIADCGDGEQGARAYAERRRLPGESLFCIAARPGHDEHARRRDQDGEPLARRHLVAEERQAEDRDLHRLGLGIGGRDYEGARLHGGEQQGRSGDLSQSGRDGPHDCRGIQLRHGQLRRRQHDGKEDEREGQAEEEAHVRGADRAQRGGQLLLHGVAQHLAAGGSHREDGP
jgi:hypothetical protein